MPRKKQDETKTEHGVTCLRLEAFELHVRVRAFANVVRVAAPFHGAPEALNVIAD